MACVFAIAVGLTEARHEGAVWFDGLFAALAAWGAVGLAQQARDLRRHFHGDQTFTAVQRSGVRFAISWRLVVVALLLGYFVLNRAELAIRVSVSEQEGDSLISYLTDQFYCTAFVLLLLTMAARGAIHKARSSVAGKFVEAGTILAGTILALVVTGNEMFGLHLVHVGCEGVSRLPARLLEPPTVPSLWSRSASFFYVSVAATLLSAVNFALLARSAETSRSSLRRLLVFFLFSVAATYIAAIWLATAGLRQASPWLHAGRTMHPPYVWMLALLVLGLSTVFLAARWSLLPWSEATLSNNDWRNGRRYVHEGIFWRLLLAIAAGGSICHEFPVRLPPVNIDPYSGWALAEWLCIPRNLLTLDLWLIAVGAILARFARRPSSLPRGVSALDARKFALTWWALLLAAPPAVVALAAFSFALYLTPWYEVPLLESLDLLSIKSL